jgi:UDP-GlcNAc:undecaprenyl-phosphate/decaprenyl-phosphate GlcNAc-1-phosphate transferase
LKGFVAQFKNSAQIPRLMNTAALPLPSLLFAIIISAFLMSYLARIARNINLVDKPTARKRHENPVPLIGGISMILALLLSVMLLPGTLSGHRTLFFSIGLLGVVGVLDDHSDIPPATKFFAQIGVAFILTTLGELSLENIGDIFNTGVPQGLNILGTAFTIMAIAGVINAFNMVDGLDGLAASLALPPLLFLAYFFFSAGDYDSYQILLVCVMVVTVFLVFNIPGLIASRRQIFMGDTGSMFIGLVIVYFLIKAASTPGTISLHAPVAPWLIGIPLLDMITVILLRLIKRRSPFLADRTHLHHVVLRYSNSNRMTLVIILVISIALIAIGILGTHFAWPDWVLFWSFVGLLIIYCTAKYFFSSKGQIAPPFRSS